MTNPKPKVASPEVIAKAERLQVNLLDVRASGEGDTITGDDVFRTKIATQLGLKPSATAAECMAGVAAVLAMNKRRDAAAAAASARRSAPIAAQPAHAARVAGKGPGFALNPLSDRVRASASSAAAPPSSSAPTLFASGDLPSFTASGIPPEALLEVPWQARHAMAAAATAADAYAVQTQCSGADAVATAESFFGNHDGNADYADRVRQWQVSAMTDDQLYNSIIPEATTERARRDAALPNLAEEEASMIDAAAVPVNSQGY